MDSNENILINKIQKREKVRELIKKIIPYDDLEQMHIDDALDWIDSDVEIWRIEKPDKPPKHLVCYTVLFDPSLRRILLIDHQKAELLLPPGGHVDIGELPYETVPRELEEELEIEEPKLLYGDGQVPFFISVVETVGKTAGHIDVDLWYVIEADSTSSLHTDSQDFQREFGDYKWVSIEDAIHLSPTITDVNLPRFATKLKTKIEISNNSSD